VSVISSTFINEPAFPSPGEGGFVRLRIDLGYDGTDFSGWALQRGQGTRTVQGVVEDALATVLRLDTRPRTTCSGRTDAGVHARGQVMHVDVAEAVLAGTDNAELLRRLNGLLPTDVRAHRLAPAPRGFDARFSPTSRIYRYRLWDDPAAVDPLRRHEVVLARSPVRVAAMNEAASALLGLRDFGAFCRRREGATTIRTLMRLSFSRTDDGLVVGTVEADAFCHSMVRSLVGALIHVGQERRDAQWLMAALTAGERTPTIHVAPAAGLTLERVVFPPDHEMTARADATRRARSSPAVADQSSIAGDPGTRL